MTLLEDDLLHKQHQLHQLQGAAVAKQVGGWGACTAQVAGAGRSGGG